MTTQTDQTRPAKPIRTTNRGARKCVQTLMPFRNSNNQLFGKWVNASTYAVYSYGAHWPLFIWDDRARAWYENEEKTSLTTTRHRSYAHPLRETLPRSCRWMRDYLGGL